MSDYISREAAIEAITLDHCYKCPVKPKTCHFCKTSSAKRLIRLVPSADVFPAQWISAKENLPEDGECVLAWFSRNSWATDKKSRKKDMDVGWQVDGLWHVDGCSGVSVIAWMQLPEPPKGV